MTDKPGVNSKPFYININENWFKKGSILTTPAGTELKVLTKPRKPFLKVLLQIITFGLYKAPYVYRCKVNHYDR